MRVIQLEQIIRGPLLSEVGDGGVNGGEVHGDELGLHASAYGVFHLVDGKRHPALGHGHGEQHHVEGLAGARTSLAHEGLVVYGNEQGHRVAFHTGGFGVLGVGLGIRRNGDLGSRDASA